MPPENLRRILRENSQAPLIGALLRLADAEQLAHLVVQKSFPGTIGLHPCPVDYELRDRALSRPSNHLFRCTWRGFDIDLAIEDVVLGQETLGFAAVGAPLTGVEK